MIFDSFRRTEITCTSYPPEWRAEITLYLMDTPVYREDSERVYAIRDQWMQGAATLEELWRYRQSNRLVDDVEFTRLRAAEDEARADETRRRRDIDTQSMTVESRLLGTGAAG